MSKPPPYNELARFIQTQNRKHAPPEIAQIAQILETAAYMHCAKIRVLRFPVQPLVNFCFAKSKELDGVGDGAKWARVGVVLQETANYNYHEAIYHNTTCYEISRPNWALISPA